MTDPAPQRQVRAKHPAMGARSAATGISATSMFAIVAALSVGSAPANAQSAEVPVSVPTTLGVVVPTQSSVAAAPGNPAQLGAAATPNPQQTAPAAVVQAAPAPAAVVQAAPAAPPAPVQLTATPKVTVLQAAPAPAAPQATTNGSK